MRAFTPGHSFRWLLRDDKDAAVACTDAFYLREHAISNVLGLLERRDARVALDVGEAREDDAVVSEKELGVSQRRIDVAWTEALASSSERPRNDQRLDVDKAGLAQKVGELVGEAVGFVSALHRVEQKVLAASTHL